MFGLNGKRDKAAPGAAWPGNSGTNTGPETHFVNGRSLEGPFPEGMQQAVFGLGCFWGAERKFWSLPGVWVTVAGYTGGADGEPELSRGLLGAHRP